MYASSLRICQVAFDLNVSFLALHVSVVVLLANHRLQHIFNLKLEDRHFSYLPRSLSECHRVAPQARFDSDQSAILSYFLRRQCAKLYYSVVFCGAD